MTNSWLLRTGRLEWGWLPGLVSTEISVRLRTDIAVRSLLAPLERWRASPRAVRPSPSLFSGMGKLAPPGTVQRPTLQWAASKSWVGICWGFSKEPWSCWRHWKKDVFVNSLKPRVWFKLLPGSTGTYVLYSENWTQLNGKILQKSVWRNPPTPHSKFSCDNCTVCITRIIYCLKISILYTNICFPSLCYTFKSFLLNPEVYWGESNSPRFYYSCMWQFMQFSLFWLHSRLFSFTIYILLGVPSCIKDAIKTEQK